MYFISCKIIGGLGNQLFQIFCTMSYGIDYNKYLIFPITNPEKTQGKYNRDTHWNDLLKELQCYILSEEKYKKKRKILYNETVYNFVKIPEYPEQSLEIYGYFQSEKYFKHNYEKICNILKIKDIKLQIYDKYKFYFNSKINNISMHFRLGDYKAIQHYHPIMNDKYYIDALTAILDKNQKYNILYFCESEDNEEIIKRIEIINGNFNNLTFIKISDDIPDWEQMIIMSLCNHNIIANSSFSWWGAYFNSRENKIVCYPNYWFGDQNINTIDLCPPQWIKIDNSK